MKARRSKSGASRLHMTISMANAGTGDDCTSSALVAGVGKDLLDGRKALARLLQRELRAHFLLHAEVGIYDRHYA